MTDGIEYSIGEDLCSIRIPHPAQDAGIYECDNHHIHLGAESSSREKTSTASTLSSRTTISLLTSVIANFFCRGLYKEHGRSAPYRLL
jgi:hypothetical protein